MGAPLAGSPFVNGPGHVAIRILLNGKEGPVGLMPPLGTTLSDDQIAGVLTYVRRSWGNQASAVDPAGVADVRKQTADITGLLDSVFGEQSSAAAPTAGNAGATSVDSYVRFAEQLAGKPAWSMAEIAALAASHDLMASGAIESINHRAIEHGLDPPIECDDDACDVDQPTLKELLAHV